MNSTLLRDDIPHCPCYYTLKKKFQGKKAQRVYCINRANY